MNTIIETDKLIIDIETEISELSDMFVVLVTKKITHKDSGKSYKTQSYREEIPKDINEPFSKSRGVKKTPVLENPTPEPSKQNPILKKVRIIKNITGVAKNLKKLKP